MNALHSPVCFTETGLLPCPAEKKAAKLADTLNHHTFSGPVSKEESPNSADFSLFPEQSGRISLHCRVYGGEGGIRTLGTVLGPKPPRVRKLQIAKAEQRILRRNAPCEHRVRSGFHSLFDRLQRRSDGDGVAESGHHGRSHIPV
jgi:hypothetical protein